MKAFTAHKSNGVNLVFPNGNSISTIWGRGSYTDNHDYSTGDVVRDFTEPIKHGSMNAEIMINTSDEKLARKISRKLGQAMSEDSVIGYVNITNWLWVLNQLAKAEIK